MSLRWSAYVAPKAPKGAQERKMFIDMLNIGLVPYHTIS